MTRFYKGGVLISPQKPRSTEVGRDLFPLPAARVVDNRQSSSPAPQPMVLPTRPSASQTDHQPIPQSTHPGPSLSRDGFVVSDDLLLNFQRCDRRAFLDTYGPTEHRDPPSDYLLKLHQDSLTHQRAVLDAHPVVMPSYPRYNWQAGADSTLNLMRQGIERIANGVLLTVRPEDGMTLVSRPKLLIKQPGTSIFGDWLYVPADIKLGKRAKSDYQIIAAFHTMILAAMQGAWPETSLLILRHQNVYEVDLFEQIPKMQDIVQDCIEMLQNQVEPEVFIARNRCDLCHWFNHCYGLAKADHHLSLLPGVTANRYVHLERLQLTTVEALAAAIPEALEDLPGFGTHVAHKLVRQAQATQRQRALMTVKGEQRLQKDRFSLTELLPTAPIELYFDIEAAPERELIYLHGVLVVDRQTQTDSFHALVAEHPDDEQHIWNEFLALAHRYPTAPIFHFCPYECQTVRKLAELYETPLAEIEPILNRFVDVHDRVVEMAILPIESYALKSIARWIGFDWRDQGANGAQSIYWYDQWLETGDRTFLDTILRYNEDDCRATWMVKDWLVEFLTLALHSN